MRSFEQGYPETSQSVGHQRAPGDLQTEQKIDLQTKQNLQQTAIKFTSYPGSVSNANTAYVVVLHSSHYSSTSSPVLVLIRYIVSGCRVGVSIVDID